MADLTSASDWVPALYSQVLQQGNFRFLEDWLQWAPFPPASALLETCRRYRADSQKAQLTPNFHRLMGYVENLFERFELAREGGANEITSALASMPDFLAFRPK